MSAVNQYSFPDSLHSMFKGDFSSPPLLFPLYFPYQSILIIAYLSLPLSLGLSLFPTSPLFTLKRTTERERKGNTDTMKSFICPIKEAEAQRKANIHLSSSSLLHESVSVHDYDASPCDCVCGQTYIPFLWCLFKKNRLFFCDKQRVKTHRERGREPTTRFMTAERCGEGRGGRKRDGWAR